MVGQLGGDALGHFDDGLGAVGGKGAEQAPGLADAPQAPTTLTSIMASPASKTPAQGLALNPSELRRAYCLARRQSVRPARVSW